MKLIIAGGTGVVGREIAAQLKIAGHSFRILTRDLERAQSLGFDSSDLFHIDYNQKSSAHWAMKGFHKLILIPPGTDPAFKLEFGKKLIDSALSSDIRHVINLSSIKANLDRSSPHYAIEKHLERRGLHFTHLRPNWFMQNFTNYFANIIKSQHSIGLYTADAKMSFIDVRDIAAVVVKILEPGIQHLNKSYELTGPEPLSHQDVANILSKSTGLPIQYTATSENDTRNYLTTCGWSTPAIERMLVLLQQVMDNKCSDVSRDIKKILGRPPTSFTQFASDFPNL